MIHMMQMFSSHLGYLYQVTNACIIVIFLLFNSLGYYFWLNFSLSFVNISICTVRYCARILLSIIPKIDYQLVQQSKRFENSTHVISKSTVLLRLICDQRFNFFIQPCLIIFVVWFRYVKDVMFNDIKNYLLKIVAKLSFRDVICCQVIHANEQLLMSKCDQVMYFHYMAFWLLFSPYLYQQLLSKTRYCIIVEMTFAHQILMKICF